MSVPVARTAMTALAAMAVMATAAAQQAPIEVAFELPLNLTHLPSTISKVSVSCMLSSQAITMNKTDPRGKRTVVAEFPVSQGEVVRTARLVITIHPLELQNPAGQQANYECWLQAYDLTTLAWQSFKGSTVPGRFTDFLLMPIPMPITGTFAW